MKLRNYGKTLVLSLLLCFGIGARADNVVRISSAQGAPDEEVTVSISLENTDAVSSLQVSIPLDENLTLVEGSGLLGSRCGGHSLTIGVKDDVLNVLVYSLSMAAITGNSGEVVSFKLRLGNQPETVTLAPTKIMLTNTDGTKVSGSTEGGTVTTFCAKAQYSMMEVDFGEVPIRSTYQKTVTVANVGNADLTITALTFSDVNVFSSTTTLPLTISAGESKDLNITYKPVERGSINKSLKVVCNSVSKLNTITLKAQPFAVNELHVQDVAGVSEEEVTVSMTMNNMDDINGYQVEFALPEQLEYVDGSFALSSRKQDHASAVSLTGNVLRIIAYSSSDKPLTGNDGEIGSFKVRLAGRYGTTLTPSKVVLSATINNKVENVVSAVYGGQVTISSPQISTSDELNFGAVPVTESCEREFAISNYGSALLTVSRVVFNNDNLSIRESLPLVVPVGGTENITVVYGSTVQQAFTATMQIYNNDPDLRVKEVSVSGSRFAPNYLSVYTKDISESENLSIDFSLDNYDIVKGLQFDVVYPGQYYTTFDNNYTLESRAEGMSVTIRQIDTNTLRVFCYFLNGSGISAGEGKIMNLQLKPKEEVPLGNYSVSVKDIKFSVEELEDKYAGTDIQSSFTVNDGTPVTITAKSYTIKYGDEIPAFEFTSDGATLEGTPSITCEATSASPVGTYPIVISKGSVTNYNVTYVNGTLTIEKAPLKITAKDYTIKQGETLPTFEATYEGFKNNETSAVLTKQPVLSTTATSASEPGEYEITVSGAEAQNYEVSYVKGKLTIVDADALIITAKSYTIKYGDDIPAFEFTSDGATLEGTPSITCEATSASPVGTYPIVISKGSVTNYNVTYVNGALTIEKAPLKITAKDYTIKQGETLPTFEATYEGFKNNETSEVLTKQPTITITATSASEPGEYEITVSGGEAQNYEMSYVKGKLTIVNADALIITAKSYTIKYGDEIPAFEFTSDGATLEGTPSITCEATSASPVGTYPIVISKGSVTNYNVTYVNGTLTIEKAPLKITAKDYTIKQGETLPDFEVTYEGFKNNETSTVLTKQPVITTTATSASEPGEYEITVSGAEAQNYEMSYVKGKLTIVDADALIITAKSYTIKYGDEIPAFEFTSDGATLEGTPAITCEATSASPVGTYPIVISKGSVTNFNVTYVNGTLTIEKAPLKITAKDYTIKQGETLPTFEATYDGFKNNETATVLTKKPVFSTTATSASEPGEYEITVSGAEAQNYEMSYVSGKLTITEASGIIGISVDNPMDIYDLQGNKVRYRATSLEGLPKGVYIINGRKVIVK